MGASRAVAADAAPERRNRRAQRSGPAGLPRLALGDRHALGRLRGCQRPVPVRRVVAQPERVFRGIRFTDSREFLERLGGQC